MAAVTAQAGWLYVLAAGALGVLAASLLAPHRLRRVSIERSVPPQVTVNEALEVRVRAGNRARRPVRSVLVRERFPALHPTACVLERVEGGSSATVLLRATARRRGVFEAGPIELECGWPFGLARSRRVADVDSPLVVLPEVTEVSDLPVEVTAGSWAEPRAAAALQGTGTEFVGVREYRPGDPVRAVHWRSSARRDDLVVRELHDEAPGDLLCVLGGRDSGSPPGSSFEALVEAAASIAALGRRRGHRVTVARASGAGEAMTLADASLPAILRWLAEAQPADRLLTPLREGLALAGRGTTCVLLAPNVGRAAAELASAVKTATTAGSRALVVVARAETWDPRVGSATQAAPRGQDERVVVRSLARGQRLDECLAG